MTPRRKRALFAAGAVLLGVLATAGLDRVVGLTIDRSAGEGLLFPPRSRILYDTPEYQALATINSLGFRGPEFAVERRPGVVRILAMGDSFTYGWGVAVEEAWPAVLERNVRAAGLDVEIANLGHPGGESTQYATLAERVIPLLRPDLVVVAMVPGNDIYQLDNPRMITPDRASVRPRRRAPVVVRADAGRPLRWLVDHAIPRVYPNFFYLFQRARPQRVTDMWVYAAPGLMQTFTDTELRRFDRLDPVVQQMYLRGLLYPTAILVPMKDPLFWVRHLDPSQPQTRELVEKMGVHFAQMREVAEAYDARILLAGLPAGPYCNRPSQAGHRRCGFTFPDSLLTHDGADDAIAIAADMGGLPYVTCTPQFREHVDEVLYFELDNHLTVEGQRLFADCLTPTVVDAVRDLGP